MSISHHFSINQSHNCVFHPILNAYHRLQSLGHALVSLFEAETIPSFFQRLGSEEMMESAEEDPLIMAKLLESQESVRIQLTPTRIVDLDGLLCGTYDRLCPKPIDYHNRRDLVRIFNIIAKEIYSGKNGESAVVEEYGSFVMDIFDERSDLDLSINFGSSIEVSRKKKIGTLRKFTKKLISLQSKGHVTGLQNIFSVRVPIIKVTDSGTGIECDLSVENRDGIVKSQIIHAISAIDERFRQLSFLMKSWAKTHNINCPKDQTLSSFSIVSLVAFHLQTRSPPILPPFAYLLKEGNDPASVAKVAKTYFNYGKHNRESLAELFITLFVKLASVEKLWQKGLCASLYEGTWTLKSWNRSYDISVEDFIDRSDNVARAVGPIQVKTIYRCIYNSLNFLSEYLKGRMMGIKLMVLLFPEHIVYNINKNKNNLPTTINPHYSPKKRHRVESQVQQPNKKTYVQPLKGTEPMGVVPMPQVLGRTVCDSLPPFKFVQDLKGTEPRGVDRMHQALGRPVYNSYPSFTPSVPYRPPAIPTTNFMAHQGYGPRTVPSFYVFNPVAFAGSYNPSIQSHPVSSQNSLGFVGTFHRRQ